MRTSYSYRVGGSLPADDPTYVIRQADNTLFQAIGQGQFCHVMGPRQVGKSSLRIKTRHRLEAEGYRCATVQLTDIILSSQLSNTTESAGLGSQNSWDKQLISLIWDSLHPADSAAIAQWLEATHRLPCQRRLEHFTRDLLFPELREKPLVIFMDEIDYLSTSPEAVHELLSWIAKCYSLRDKYGEYEPLSFVLLGSTPWSAMTQFSLQRIQQRLSGLDTDRNAEQDSSDRAAKHLAIQHLLTAGLTCEITLSNFKLSEMRPLEQGFTAHFSSPVAALQSIYRWTNGQPFLTQKLCHIVVSQAKGLSPVTLQRLSAVSIELNSWIDRIVQGNILHNWADNDDPVHLESIRDRLAQSPRYLALNHLYKQIFSGDRIRYSGNALQAELLISGLVLCRHQHLYPANKIYQAVFSKQAPHLDHRKPASSHSLHRSTLNNNIRSFAKSAAKNALNSLIHRPAPSAIQPLAPLLSIR